MLSSLTSGSSIIVFGPEHRCRRWPSLWTKELGTPNSPAIRFTRGTVFAATLVRNCYGLSGCWPPCTDLTGLSANGGFYFQAFDRSVALPVAGYNYNSVWTPLLAGLSPAGMAASVAALARPRPAPNLLVRRWGGVTQGACDAHISEDAGYHDDDRDGPRQTHVPLGWDSIGLTVDSAWRMGRDARRQCVGDVISEVTRRLFSGDRVSNPKETRRSGRRGCHRERRPRADPRAAGERCLPPG
jgi:hypothetical protein